MIWLSIIWGIFALVFLALGCFQWNRTNKSISHLQVSGSQLMQQIGVDVRVKMAGIDFVEFVDKFNSYLDYYNQTSKKQNKAQAIGYWVASATAIFSFVLAMVS